MDDIRDPQYRTPDGSALRIWRDAAQNKFLSEREGRAIYDEVIYAEVISPGSRDSTPVFELIRVCAKEMNHPAPLYGLKYEEYKTFIEDFEKSEGNDASLSGTPLAQWPEMTRTMVAALKAQHIFTVDALAALPDTKLYVVGPDGRSWREKAIAYVESAKSGAYATELAAKLETTLTELADERERAKALAERVQALENAKSGVNEAPPPVVAPAPAQTATEASPAPTGKAGKTPPPII